MDKEDVVQSEATFTNATKETDGSIHIEHKDEQTFDDFSLHVMKTKAYKTMTNN